jgi:hypothetical protein
MKPFSNKHTRRKTAFAALFVWLFALASGIANACLLEAPGTHAQAHLHVTKTGAEKSHAHAALAGHAVSSEDDDSTIPKGPCLKVCDDGSKAPVKLQTGSDLTDPGMATLVAVVWDAAAPFVSAPGQRDDLQPPIVGPPSRVRYSRLAL